MGGIKGSRDLLVAIVVYSATRWIFGLDTPYAIAATLGYICGVVYRSFLPEKGR